MTSKTRFGLKFMAKFPMPKLPIGAFDSSQVDGLVRGAEVWLHHFHMRSAALGTVGGGVALTGVAASLLSARIISGSHWPLFWRYNVARVLDAVGLQDPGVNLFAGRFSGEFVSRFGAAYHDEFWLTLPLSVAIGAGAAYAALRWILKRFVLQNAKFADKHLRGRQIATQAQLVETVREFNAKAAARFEAADPKRKPLDVSFCGVPVPAGMAQRNFLATGGMGSGKSVALFVLADQVAAAQRAMVIYDKVGEFTSQYYRPGSADVVLNPYDTRFPGWNIFNEVRELPDFEVLASAFIPKRDNADETSAYFRSNAQTVFASILQRLWEEGFADPSKRTNEAVCKKIFETGQDALYTWLKGTAAESLLNPESKGSGGGGVLTTLSEAAKVLRYIKSGEFSMRAAVEAEAKHLGGRRIFINSTEEFATELKPLTSLMMALAYRNWMKQDQVGYDRVWFFVDEFASLGSLPVLKNAVTEARKFGVVTCIGAQNVAQFDSMFGKDDAKVIRSNLQNYVVLRVADEDTAETYSKLIGAEELDELSESVSFGASDNRDGKGTQITRKDRRLVTASEIQVLEDMHGFLQFAGTFPTAKVQYSYTDRLPKPADWQPQPGFDKRDLSLPTAPPPAPAEATPSAGAAPVALELAAMLLQPQKRGRPAGRD